MKQNISEQQMQLAKSQSRGVNCDMSPDAILRRLDIVDELRELAKDLQNAKRLGSLHVDESKTLQSKRFL